MKIAVPKERRAREARVAASPETVKKLVALGAAVTVEAGAGAAASMLDAAYQAAGATIAADIAPVLADADAVLKVQRPSAEEIATIKQGAMLCCIMAPHADPETVKAASARGLVVFGMEFIPRITRAQSMDVLSSQANLAGYRAVIEAAAHYTRAFPMFMTAAGTVQAARCFVLGAGVAGLQAIATARRLGAQVSATDVRKAAGEQVESLGAKYIFIDLPEGEGGGGYARALTPEEQQKQAALVAQHIKAQDIVITTALIPGRPAPKLITQEMVESMKPGSVIVDVAIDQGGCAETSKATTHSHPTYIVDDVVHYCVANMPGAVARTSTFALSNVTTSFVLALADKGWRAALREDPNLRAGLNVHGGRVTYWAVAEALGLSYEPADKVLAA